MAARYWVGDSAPAYWDDSASPQNWAASSGGSGGETVPTADDDVYFDAEYEQCIGAATMVCKSLTISSNFADLDLNDGNITISGALAMSGGLLYGGSGTISVAGAINMSGGTFTPETSTLKITSSANVTLSAGNPYKFESAASEATLQTALTTSNNLDITSGTLVANGKNITCGGTFSINASCRLRMFVTETITAPTIASGGIIQFAGDNVSNTKTVPNWSYKTIQVNDTNTNKSTFKFGEAHTEIETFTITAGTFSQSAGDYAITCTGLWLTSSGVFVGGTAAITAGYFLQEDSSAFTSTSGTFSIGGNFEIKTGTTFTHNSGTIKFTATTVLKTDARTLSKMTVDSSGTVTLTTSALNTAGLLTVANGTFDTNDLACTVGSLTMSGGVLTGGSSTISVGGDCNMGAGTFTAETSTLKITAASTVTLSAGNPYKFEVASVDALVTLATALTTTNTTIVTSGLFFAGGRDITSGSTFSVASGASFYLMGTETITAPSLNTNSTVAYVGDDVASAKTMKNWTYGNLLIYDYNTNKSTFQFGQAHTELKTVTVTIGTLDLNDFNNTCTTLTVNGGTLLGGTGTLTVGGHCTMSSGTFTAETSTLKITKDCTLTLSAGNPWKFVLDDGEVGYNVTLATNMTTGSDITITSGGFIYSGKNLTCGGTYTVAELGYLQLQGVETSSAPTIHVNSSVGFVGDNVASTKTLPNWNYTCFISINDVNANKSTFKFGEAHTEIGYFAILSGTFSQAAGDFAIGFNGMYITGTFIGGTAAITVDTTIALKSGCAFTSTSGILTCDAGSAILQDAGATFTHNSGTINFTGTGTSYLQMPNWNVNNVTINMSGAAESVAFNGAINAAGVVTVTTGTLDLYGGALTVAGAFTVASGATFKLQGSEVTCSTPTLASGSTVVYYGNNVASTKTLKNWSYKSLTINDVNVNKSTFKFGEAHTEIESFQVLSGTFSQAAGDYAITCTYLLCYGTFLGGSATITINNGNLDLDGGAAFTSTSGTLVINTGYLFVQGGATFTHNSGTLDFTGTGSNVIYLPNNANNVTINMSTTTDEVYLGANLTAVGTVTVTTGILSVAGRNLTVSGAFNVAANGTLKLKGTETVSTPTLATGSTVWYYGDNVASTKTMKNWSYANLTINDANANKSTFSMGEAHTEIKLLTVTAGTFLKNAHNLTCTGLTINGGTCNWHSGSYPTINGTFTMSSGQFDLCHDYTRFNGSVVYTGGTFNDGSCNIECNSIVDCSHNWSGRTFGGSGCSFSPIAGKTLTLASNITHVYGGGFGFGGAGTFDCAGYNITATYSLSFGATNTFKMKGSETISIPSILLSIAAGHTWIYYGDNTGTTKTMYNGPYKNLTINDVNASPCTYKFAAACSTMNTLTVTAGTLSQSAGDYALTCTGYTQTGGTFTGGSAAITVNGNFALSVGTFTSTSGTLTLGGATLSSSNSFTFTSGVFNHNSGKVVFDQSWSRVRAVTGSILLNNLDIQNTHADGTGDGIVNIGATTTITVTGTLNLIGPALTYLNTGTINAQGNITVSSQCANSSDAITGTATITMTGTGDKTIVASGTYPTLPNLIINKASGNVTASGGMALIGDLTNIGSGNFYQTGTLTLGIRYGTSAALSMGASDTFNNLTFGGHCYGVACNITGTVNVLGNLYLTGESGGWVVPLNGGTLLLSGNMTVGVYSGGGTVAVTFIGGNAQVYTNNGGTMPSGTFTINKTVGTAVTLASNLVLNTAGQDLSITSGTLDLSTRNLTVNDTITINGGTLTQGSGTITCTSFTVTSGTFNGGSNTITFYSVTISSGVVNMGSATWQTTSYTTSGSVTSWNCQGGTIDAQTSTFLMQSTGGWSPSLTVDNTGGMTFNNVTFTGGTAPNLTTVGTVNINGLFTLDDGLTSFGGTWSCRGNVRATIGTAACYGTGVIKLEGVGAQKVYVDEAGGWSYFPAFEINNSGTVTFKDNLKFRQRASMTVMLYTSGTAVFDSSSILELVSEGGFTPTLTVNMGAQAINAFKVNWLTSAGGVVITGTLTCNGDLTIAAAITINGGTIAVAGNIVLNDTIVDGTCAVTWNGSGSKTLTATGGTGELPDGTFTINGSGTLTLASALALDATGQDLTITSGTLDLASFALTVNDAFTIAASGTLKLKGTETITKGSLVNSGTVQYYDSGTTAVLNNLGTSFTNLTLGESKTHNITAGTTIAVTGTFASDGTSSTRSILRSATPTSYWNLNLSGTSTLTDKVDVQDSNASSGSTVLAYGSVNSGHNVNWNFASANARYCVGATWNTTASWSLASGGTSGASIPTTTHDAIFDDNSPSCGINAAVSVLSMNLTSLYANTLTQNANTIAAPTWNQAGGTFTGGTSSITIASTFLLSSGTFNAGTQAIGLTGSSMTWTVSGGTFNANASTVTFTIAYFQPITITGSHSLFNVRFTGATSQPSSGITLTAGTTLTVNGTFTSDGTSGGVPINTGTVDCKGDIVIGTGNYNGTGLILISGTSAQTLTGSGGIIPALTINKSDTLNIVGTLQTYKTWTYTAGTINPGTSTITFSVPFNGTITVNGTQTLANVTFSSGSWNEPIDLNITNSLTVTGTLTFGAGNNYNVNTGTVNAQGNVVIAGANIVRGSASFNLTGTADQTITSSGGDGTFRLSPTINKASGTVSLATNLNLNFAGEDLTVTSGTLNQAGYNLTVKDALTINGGTLSGGGTITCSSITLSSGAINQGGIITCTNMTVNGGTFTGGTAALNINNALTISSSGVFAAGAQTITLLGDFNSTGGTFTANSSTVVLDPQNTPWPSSQDITGSPTFNNLTINNTTCCWEHSITLAGGSTVTVNGTLAYASSYAGYSIYINGGTIAAKGNISHNNQKYFGTTVLLINGTSDQTFTGTAGGCVSNVTINKSSGTLYLVGTIGIFDDVNNNAFTYTAGTIDAGTSTFVFNACNNHTLTINGTLVLCNVTLGVVLSPEYGTSSGGIIAISNTLTATGTTSFASSLAYTLTINTGTLVSQGNVSINTRVYNGSATWNLTGTANQSITSTGGSGTFRLSPTINKASGTVTLATALDLNYAGEDLTVTSGTLDLAGYNLTVNDQFTVAAAGTIRLKGTEASVSTPIIAAGGTVEYYGTNVGTNHTIKNWNYKNLIINDINGTKDRFVFGESHTEIVNLTVTDGNLDLAGFNLTASTSFNVASDGLLWVKGSEVSVSDPTFATNAICVYYGDNTGTTKTMKNWSYENLTIYDANVSTDTFIFGENHFEIKTLNIIDGILNYNNKSIGVVNITSSGGSVNFTDGVCSVTGDVDLSGCSSITANIADFFVNGTGSQSIDLYNSVWDTITVTNPSASSVTFIDGFETNELVFTVPGSHIIFGSTKIFKVNTLLQIFGTSLNPVTIESTSSGSAFILNAVCPIREVGYTNVKDSNNNSGVDIYCSFGIDNGGNTGWVFVNKFIWSGSGIDNLASTAGNWVGGTVPEVLNTVLFNGTGTKNCAWDLVGHYSMIEVDIGYSGILTLDKDLYLDTNFDQQAGTVLIGGATKITIEGNFYIGAGGTFIANIPIEVWQNISLDNNATIDLSSATLILNGWGVQSVAINGFAINAVNIPNIFDVITILGGMTVTTFTITIGAFVKFEAGKTITVDVFTFSGFIGYITLRSTIDGSYWNLNLTGSSGLSNKVNVRDSDASYGFTVSAINSVDSGHNNNWFFGTSSGINYVGKKILPFPYEYNNARPTMIVGAIVDPVTMEVINYLPFRAIDNGDGTATLVVM